MGHAPDHPGEVAGDAMHRNTVKHCREQASIDSRAGFVRSTPENIYSLRLVRAEVDKRLHALRVVVSPH